MDAVTPAKQMTERDWWDMRARGAGTTGGKIGQRITDAETVWAEGDLRFRMAVIAKAFLNG